MCIGVKVQGLHMLMLPNLLKLDAAKNYHPPARSQCGSPIVPSSLPLDDPPKHGVCCSCSMSMHVFAACLLHFHACLFIFMHIHSSPCCMFLVQVHPACPCFMSILNVLAACPGWWVNCTHMHPVYLGPDCVA